MEAPEGITVEELDGRVVIEIPAKRWEGDAVQLERLLTQLHYVLGRARPGINIVSMFVNGKLWGGKTIEADPARALDNARHMIERLAAHVEELEAQVTPQAAGDQHRP